MTHHLTVVRRIRATPAEVYAALLTPDLIMQWWSPDAGPTLSAQVDPRVGGELRVAFQMMNGQVAEALGTFRELSPGRRVVLSFAWATEPDLDTLVVIDLAHVEIGTELTLTHSRFGDPSQRDAHREGWAGTLDNLAALFETGSQQGARR